MISIIIPARNERYLNQTIRGVFEKAEGSVEVIVTLDGYDTERLEGVTYIYNEEPKGMRTAINQAVAVAKGEYLMKLDAHCMLDRGFDTKLIKEHQDKWVQIPTRKRLNAKAWQIIDDGRPDINYMYLVSNSIGTKDGVKNRDEELKKKVLDDTETFQGSCYFIKKAYFLELGLLDDVNFAGSGHEAQEIALKVRRDGGRVIRNKNTWYAHARMSRRYTTDREKSRKYMLELIHTYEN